MNDEKFGRQVIEAYKDVKLSEYDNIIYKQRIMERVERKEKRDRYFEMMIWVATSIVFVVLNTFIIKTRLTNEETRENSVTQVYVDETLCEPIKSADMFFEKYPGGNINGTEVDYLTNGQGELLNEAALADKSGAYRDLFEPKMAATRLLNIDFTDNNVVLYTVNELDSSGVTVCFLFTDSGKYVYVKMIKPFGGEGIWIPQTAQKANYEEYVVNVEEADVTNDGVKDYIVTSVTTLFGNVEIEYDKNYEENFKSGVGICYVRVYRGGENSKINEYYDKDCIWWKRFSADRLGNGFVVLCEENGQSYIMTGNINEQQGVGTYEYEIFYINEETQIMDKYSVSFSTENEPDSGVPVPQEKRSQAVSRFQEKITKWFDNAVLIVSFDALDDKNVYISGERCRYKPREYFDKVWARMNE